MSVEGIECLAKRLGLQHWKDKKETGDAMAITLEGNIIVVDIDFTGTTITDVALSFANTLGSSNDLAPLAAAILRHNLTPPNTPPLISDLTAFAANLSRLSKLDKLSSSHSLNCFTALTGLYESLRVVYGYESSAGGAGEALVRGNGWPRMHGRWVVGLSIEYWVERRRIPGVQREYFLDMDMEAEVGIRERTGEYDGEKLWRLIVEIDELGPECAALDPARCSAMWIDKNNIVKTYINAPAPHT